MSNEKEAKLKALKLTLDKLDKAYGKGTVMKMSDAPVVDVDVISSGSWIRSCLRALVVPKGTCCRNLRP